MGELVGQVAVISGGLGDLGRACAIKLAQRGADIAVSDIRENDRVGRLRDEVQSRGRRFRFDVSDVTDEQQTAAWLSEVQESFGTVSLGVCNAAIVEPLDYASLTAAAWRRHLDVNLTGAYVLANDIARRLVEQKKPGRIVFLGSWAAESVHTQIPAYCVSKAGLRMLCRSMALAYAPHNILINEVAPGIVEAGLSRHLFDEDSGLRDAIPRTVPAGRLLTAGDIAGLVAWLCDPENNCMAGATLQADGGISLVSATDRNIL